MIEGLIKYNLRLQAEAPHESVEKLDKSVVAQCSMCESEGEINEFEDNNIPQLNDDPERMQ